MLSFPWTRSSQRPRPGARPTGVVADVCRRALVDAARPAAPEWVHNVEGKAPDIGDLHLDVITVLECAKPLVVGAHEQHVARLHRGERGCPRDRLGNAVREVTRIVIRAELAADP